MMALDERLRVVASMVEKGSRIADIGTDHAYLPVWLVENGVCPSAIAADLRSHPLEMARRHIEEAELTQVIQTRLGDGLSPIDPEEVDAIIIAGMGGETIAAILRAAEWLTHCPKRLILQPMTKAEETRRQIFESGYMIAEEHLVTDGRHLYPVMAAVYAGGRIPADEVTWYAGAFSSEEGKPYRRTVAIHLRRRGEGARCEGNEAEARHWFLLADQIENL